MKMGFLRVKDLLIITIGIIWASNCSGSPQMYTTQAALDNEGSVSSLPSSQPLKQGGCVVNADCQDNHYCGGKTKRCIECFDCEKVQRRPRSAYDGPACATHQTECGQCNDGYEELGGVCRPKRARTDDYLPFARRPNDEASSNVKEEEKDGSPLAYIVTGGVVVAVALFGVVVYGTYIISQKRPGQRFQNEEESGLTSEQGSFHQTPTAPLATNSIQDEYLRQPPYFPQPPQGQASGDSRHYFRTDLRTPIAPKVLEESAQGALPFAAGNGPSNFIVLDGEANERRREEQEYSSGDDEVDGGAPVSAPQPASRPTESRRRSLPLRRILRSERPGRNLNESYRQPMVAIRDMMRMDPIGPPEPPIGSNAIVEPQMAPVTSRVRPLPSQGSPPAGSVPRIRRPSDPTIGRFQVGFYGQIEFPLMPGFADIPPPQPPPAPRQAALRIDSAPSSPGRIDDTYMDLRSIRGGRFQDSDISLDSGTGTNDREVPSGPASTSGSEVPTHFDLAELDVSMYADESYHEPSSPPRVPDLNYVDANPRGYDEINDPMLNNVVNFAMIELDHGMAAMDVEVEE